MNALISKQDKINWKWICAKRVIRNRVNVLPHLREINQTKLWKSRMPQSSRMSSNSQTNRSYSSRTKQTESRISTSNSRREVVSTKTTKMGISSRPVRKDLYLITSKHLRRIRVSRAGQQWEDQAKWCKAPRARPARAIICSPTRHWQGPW